MSSKIFNDKAFEGEEQVKSSLGESFEASQNQSKADDNNNNNNNEIEKLNAEIEKLQEQLSQAKSQVLLAFADKENAIKRLENEKKDAIVFANQSLLKLLVEPLEQLFLALAQKPNESESQNYKNMYLGVEMTKNELTKVFSNNGLKRIYPEGQKFDPNLHQAISIIEDANFESQTVKTVVQAGYELHGRLIKPALCIVVK